MEYVNYVDQESRVSTTDIKDLSGHVMDSPVAPLSSPDLICNLNVCPALRAIYYVERAPLRLNSCVHS